MQPNPLTEHHSLSCNSPVSRLSRLRFLMNSEAQTELHPDEAPLQSGQTLKKGWPLHHSLQRLLRLPANNGDRIGGTESAPQEPGK